MRSNMLNVEIMPVSVIVTIAIISFICAFIGNYLIIKGISELKQEQKDINYVIQDEIKK